MKGFALLALPAALILIAGSLPAPAHAAAAKRSTHRTRATGHSVTWTARMTGAQESPAVKTKVTGNASVRLVAFGDSSVHYRIQTTHMADVTMAHLHEGAKGENGPIVVTLQTPEKKGTGMVSQGVFHASDLSGPLAGKRLEDFAAAVDSGNVYVNVHTQANPDGEIRGQLHKGAGGASASATGATHTTRRAHRAKADTTKTP